VSDDAEILASKMTLNLNEPSKIGIPLGLNQSNTLVFGGK
jgi:hypothetical protein